MKSQLVSRGNPQAVTEEFMSIFLAELLKQVFKNQSLLSEQNDFYGGLPNAGLYNDFFVNQMAQTLIQKGFLPSDLNTTWLK